MGLCFNAGAYIVKSFDDNIGAFKLTAACFKEGKDAA